MVINLNELWVNKTGQLSNFTLALDWLKDQYGGEIKSFFKEGLVFGQGWRTYSTQMSVDGLTSMTWWIEFDNDNDATAFLLRWS
jgi:hypothetical protein